jgi:hypothetical protein
MKPMRLTVPEDIRSMNGARYRKHTETDIDLRNGD